MLLHRRPSPERSEAVTVYQTIGLLLTLAALASYVNHRFLRLPQTIGLMAIALMCSLALVGLGHLGVTQVRTVAQFVSSIDFGDVLLHGMLAFLLFAGALHVDLGALQTVILPVGVLATVGLLISTAVTAGLFWLGAWALGFHLPFLAALLFGALIAPTDPIAVMGIIKQARAPERLETVIVGESLFNDGVAVVVFLALLDLTAGKSTPTVGGLGLFFLKEGIGGGLLGLFLGYLAYRLIKSVDAYQVEVLLTLALVSGGYALAEALHVSAPIAMVAAGLLVGNHGRMFAMSDNTRERLDSFWELIDDILNAVLFMLIGLEIIVLPLDVRHVLAGSLAIAATLVGRFASVSAPIRLMRGTHGLGRGVVTVLTWGGLRGGISIALALSLPPAPDRDVILAATYVVVVFSVLVQGLTFGRLIAAKYAGNQMR